MLRDSTIYALILAGMVYACFLVVVFDMDAKVGLFMNSIMLALVLLWKVAVYVGEKNHA